MRDRVAISENCDPCKCNVRARVRSIPFPPPSLPPEFYSADFPFSPAAVTRIQLRTIAMAVAAAAQTLSIADAVHSA